MEKICWAGVGLILLLAHPALAQSGGQRIARACAVDFQRLCAGQRVARDIHIFADANSLRIETR
jgi:hypothetical protein